MSRRQASAYPVRHVNSEGKDADNVQVLVDLLPRLWKPAGEPYRSLDRDTCSTTEPHREREPWLVIDPKPPAGEREFSLAPIVRPAELGGDRRDLLYRLGRGRQRLTYLLV